MGLALAAVPHEKGGVAAAMEYLTKDASKLKPAVKLNAA
jgi:hypothetical protein